MIRRPPRSTLTDTRVPCTSLFLSLGRASPFTFALFVELLVCGLVSSINALPRLRLRDKLNQRGAKAKLAVVLNAYLTISAFSNTVRNEFPRLRALAIPQIGRAHV